MKRIFTIMTAMLLFAATTFAQEAQTINGPVTLDQAIQYALRNAVSAQNAILDQEIATARVKETTGLGLPQVVVSSALTYNQKLPRFFQSYQPPTEGSISFFPEIPGLAAGSVVAAQNFFQLQASGDANVTVNQLIFNGSYFVGLQAAAAYKDLAFKNTAVNQQTIIQNVTKAYYGALIYNDRLKNFESNIARLDTTVRNTKALFENGFAESIDVDRFRVSYNNLVTQRNQAMAGQKLAIDLLKFQMNYPLTQDLQIVGSIEDVVVTASPDAYSEGFTYENRFDYQALEANRKLQALNLKNQHAGALPTISGFARTGYATQSANIGGLFKTNTNLGFESDQIGPDKWYNYTMFGVNLNWNLFTGTQRHFKIQQEKLALQKIDNNVRNLKAGIDIELRTTTVGYENALKSLTVQKENMELAANVARVTRIKFEQGVGSNLEVVQAEADYRDAQNNYYGALYDAMVTKVDLDKAYGRFTPATTETK